MQDAAVGNCHLELKTGSIFSKFEYVLIDNPELDTHFLDRGVVQHTLVAPPLLASALIGHQPELMERL